LLEILDIAGYHYRGDLLAASIDDWINAGNHRVNVDHTCRNFDHSALAAPTQRADRAGLCIDEATVTMREIGEQLARAFTRRKTDSGVEGSVSAYQAILEVDDGYRIGHCVEGPLPDAAGRFGFGFRSAKRLLHFLPIGDVAGRTEDAGLAIEIYQLARKQPGAYISRFSAKLDL